MSYCHPVILSSCYPVILSSCHPVILSSGHLVIWSSGHLVIWSYGHMVIKSPSHQVFRSSSHPIIINITMNERTNNIRTSRSASQTNTLDIIWAECRVAEPNKSASRINQLAVLVAGGRVCWWVWSVIGAEPIYLTQLSSIHQLGHDKLISVTRVRIPA